MTGTPLLETRALTKEFRGFRAVSEVDLTVAERHRPRPGRPERSRQDHAVQPAHRVPPADVRGRPVRRPGHHRPAPEQIAPLGIARSFQITSLFEAMTLRRARRARARQPDRLGKQWWRRSRGWPGSGRAPWSCSSRSASRTGPGSRRVARVRPEARARTRARAGPRPAAAAARRADRRDGRRGRRPHHRPRQRVATGRTVVLVDHNMHVVGSLADRVTVLQSGQVLAEGPYEQVRADERVITAYLGQPAAVTTAHDRCGIACDARGLSAWYGEARVLRDVSLDVAPGEVVTLVGRNGAGKTTLLRSRHGPAPADRRAPSTFDGADLARLGPTPAPAPASAGCPTTAASTRRLTVEENLMLPPVVHPDGVAARAASTSSSRCCTSAATSPAPSCPGASSRCSPWPGCCGWAPACCCSTSRARAWPRSSSSASARSSARSRATGSACCSSSRTSRSPPTVADRHYLLAQGKVVEHARQRRRSGRARASCSTTSGM